jgi:hypothetical protein
MTLVPTSRLRVARPVAIAMIALVVALPLGSCSSAAKRRPAGVPIEERPTPPQPEAPRAPETDVTETPRPVPPERRPSSPPSSPAEPVESVMTPAERRATLARIAADTSSAGAAVRKCATRKLLPDQESVWDTTRSLLVQTRSALVRGELWRAESLARKARQLAASLSCP